MTLVACSKLFAAKRISKTSYPVMLISNERFYIFWKFILTKNCCVLWHIVGYLMSNFVYAYILDIHDLHMNSFSESD